MTATGTEARVCADIAARQQAGIAKYGTTVESNPLTQREWLQHAYEECLDQAVYLRRLIEEMEGRDQRSSCQEIEAQITGDLCHALDDKPWYPDDSGKWVEVPLGLLEMPETLSPGLLIEVMTLEERSAKEWIWYPPEAAAYWDWGMSPNCIDRIVAYKVVV